ncbi:MAG: glycosyltransferase family 4 protein [Candidatus Omnitrophota bacterium]
MKILFVNKHVNESGGIEYYIHALARRLKEKGHRIGVIHWEKVESTGNFDARYFLPELWDDLLSLGKKTSDKLDDIIKEYSPDIVYLHNVENGEVVAHISSRVRTVQFIHDYKIVDPDGRMLLYNPLEVNTYPLSLSCFLRAYSRRSMPRNPIKGVRAYLRAKRSLEAAKRLEKVIVASNHMKKTLVENGLEFGKISVLPYFIDYQGLRSDFKPEKKRILFSGRIMDAKGLGILIDSIGSIKRDFVLDVAGTGPMEKSCREKAERVGLSGKVHFHGWVRHEALPEFYRSCLFLVMPSVWPEPFGISGIEAAYFARPSIAYNVGGISDWLIDGETGFLVEPYDKGKMAEKINYLLDNPEEAERLGRRARELAIKKYDPDLHIEKLLEIFKSL